MFGKTAGTAAVAAASALAFAALAPATQAATPPGPVLVTPITSIPHFPAQTATVEQIRQIAQCGNTVYAVGSFSVVKRQSTTYARNNIFSFSAIAPYTVTSWAPDVNGTVNSITFNGGNCASAYIGGKFTAVGSTSVKNIAKIDTSTGSVDTAFGHSASGKIETLASYGNHILAGGYFTSINGSPADPFMASLNPTTGKNDGFVHLAISGNYQFAGVSNNTTNIYNQEISHSGTLDLVMGDFTSVGGQPRQQIFMLNLATTPASVTAWTSPQWDGSQGEATPQDPGNGYPYQCATVEPFYIQAAAWSPDDATVYIATTGYHPNGWPTSGPRTGLCDAAAAFPATQAPVLAKWINYTGCDSLFAAAADSAAVYIGGHERFASNGNSCDSLGSGGFNAPGLAGLDPQAGNLMLNSAGTAGLYSRGRGLGADDMLITSAGLWIASDNYQGTQMCDGVNGLGGLCLLPYPK